MTIPSKTEFDAKKREQKIDILLKMGSYLYWKREEGYNLYLYSLGDFYVQLWLSRTTAKIVKLESFSSDDALLPFVDDIELPE